MRGRIALQVFALRLHCLILISLPLTALLAFACEDIELCNELKKGVKLLKSQFQN